MARLVTDQLIVRLRFFKPKKKLFNIFALLFSLLVNAANFIQVAGSSGTVSAATASNTNTKGVGFSNTQCSNGFVPGQVVINQVPNGQAFETTNTKQNCKLFASDEDDDGTVAIRYPTFKYTSSVASSSCSSSNSKTSNSFFEKLGCN